MFSCGRGVKISQNAVRNHTAGHYINNVRAAFRSAHYYFYTYQTLKLTEVSP